MKGTSVNIWLKRKLVTSQFRLHLSLQKSLLMKVSEKAGLKLNTQKSKIMASSPIISWQIDGTKVETLEDFIFLGSKITAVAAATKLKRYLLLGREAMTRLDSILKI